MKQVLLITDVKFWELSSGNKIRIEKLITFLQQHVQLTVVHTGPVTADCIDKIKREYQIQLNVLESENFLSSFEYKTLFNHFTSGKVFDSIIVEYIHCAWFLADYNTSAKLILDIHDIISLRNQEFSKYGFRDDIFTISSEEEFNIFRQFDHVICLTKPDFNIIQQVIGHEKVLLCPHPAEIFFHDFYSVSLNLTFVASGYLPNIDGITYFINHCWNEILKQNAEATLSIYGNICQSLILEKSESIFLRGYANNISEVYEFADLVINPTRFGAGQKIKNIEALAHGKPLVTTSHAANGLEQGRNWAYMVADDPSESIDTICHLLHKPLLRKQLGINAHIFSKRWFSEKICFVDLLKIL